MKIDINNLLKQTQEMQSKMQSVQEDLAKIIVVGDAGNGLVTVTMDGRHVVKAVYIDPSVFTERKEFLEELLVAAHNNALEKAEEEARKKLNELYATQIQTKFGEIETES